MDFLLQEARDKIAALEAENARLKKLLEPFAKVAEYVAKNRPGWDHDEFTFGPNVESRCASACCRGVRGRLCLTASTMAYGRRERREPFCSALSCQCTTTLKDSAQPPPSPCASRLCVPSP